MMTSRFPEITDELLSAYIDNAISESERALVEQAVQEDTALAWRLVTLRETVRLLHALPVLHAPRAFVLTAEMVGQASSEPVVSSGVVTLNPAARKPTEQPASRPGRWEQIGAGWRQFWQGGSPVWRNAMATSMVAFLVLLVLPALLTGGVSHQSVGRISGAADMVSLESVELYSDAPVAAFTEDESSTTVRSEAAAPASEEAVVVAKLPAVANSIATFESEPAAPPALAVSQPPVASGAAEPLLRSAAPMTQPMPEGAAPAAPEATVPRTLSPESNVEDALSVVTSTEVDVMPAFGAAAESVSSPMAQADTQMSGAPAVERAAEPSVSAAAAVMEFSPAAVSEAEIAAAPAVAEAAAISVALTTEPMATAPIATALPATIAATSVTASATATLPTQIVALTAPSAQEAVAPVPPVASVSPTLPVSLLPWLQAAAAMAVGGFGLLWWRSRRTR